jgi:hypothetical protein
LARLFIPSSSGRKRYNGSTTLTNRVLGAIDAITHQLITVCNETYINACSVCDLLHKIRNTVGTVFPITIVLDNARYQRCDIVTDLAKELKIELLFLPSYSPNLNLMLRQVVSEPVELLSNRRTLLNIGFLNGAISIDELNQVRRMICKRYQDIKGVVGELFEIQENNPEKVINFADRLWNELVEKHRIDIGGKQQKEPTVGQRNMVFEESIRHPDVREIGGEWLCRQALDQLKLADFLTNTGFSEEETQLALTQIIARAVYISTTLNNRPASELETSRWVRENSAVCSVTGYPIEKITKDKLYKSALKLFSEKEKIENFLSIKTCQLFDTVAEQFDRLTDHLSKHRR